MNNDEYTPTDWSDKAAWNDYLNAELRPGHIPSHAFLNDAIVLRFLSLAHEKGGRIWFPGCGLDPYPKAYAERGCKVLATDFATVAVVYQRRVAAAMLKAEATPKIQGTLAVAEHDFTYSKPEGEFDLVINSRAFQRLSAGAMRAAAGHFYAALRPGGVCILDIMNVQASHLRKLIEDNLIGAGFFLPGVKSERWYRQQLDSTGIVYGMILGRPCIPNQHQYPPEQFHELAGRDQQILDSFRSEYEQRVTDEAGEANALGNNPAAKSAQVVYATS